MVGNRHGDEAIAGMLATMIAFGGIMAAKGMMVVYVNSQLAGLAALADVDSTEFERMMLNQHRTEEAFVQRAIDPETDLDRYLEEAERAVG